MFRDFDLTFTKDVQDYVRDRYGRSKVILEYGSGGSTCLAARTADLVITCESDPRWLLEIVGKCSEEKLPARVIPIWADLGPTKKWGYPEGIDGFKNWPSYARKPWEYCKEHKLKPDLILVDGRFRVASFLASCLSVEKQTPLLFDDFVGRDQYKVVSSILEPYEIIGNRMAVFLIEPNLIQVDQLYSLFDYFYIPL